MSKSWKPYALHNLDAIAKIRRIEERGSIAKDDILYDAALRNLQTLSESTQKLPETLKANFPQIPWKNISGFRNILVHNYLGEIDAKTVEQVIEHQLGPVEDAINAMLTSHSDSMDED